MKIALLGYGKMGQVIEQIALKRRHEIVLKKDENNTYNGLENADVAIDFSVPTAAIDNITACLKTGIPVISGTTGWLQDYDTMVKLCNEKKGAMICSSNFSLGVNLFFKINEYLAKVMTPFTDYNINLEEIHHTQKLDAPSGTAISLAEGIIKNSNYKKWFLADETSKNKNNNEQIPIQAFRVGNVPGTHSVTYDSEIDTIEIKHTAHNRHGFALGAVIAAEWIVGKIGVFSMKDVLE